MHPERDVSDMKETCGIHSGYMQHTCILRGCQDTCWVHAGYMRDACDIHTAGYVSLGLKGMYRCHHRVCSAPIRPPICSLCCSGSSPAPCSSSIFCFVMATPKAEARAVAVRATATGRRRKEPPPSQPRSRREARELLWHLKNLPRHLPRHLRQLRRLPRRRPSAHPSAPASRARDTCTYPRMYPYVSDMYHECILCVMYLRVKIHCILNVS